MERSHTIRDLRFHRSSPRVNAVVRAERRTKPARGQTKTQSRTVAQERNRTPASPQGKSRKQGPQAEQQRNQEQREAELLSLSLSSDSEPRGIPGGADENRGGGACAEDQPGAPTGGGGAKRGSGYEAAATLGAAADSCGTKNPTGGRWRLARSLRSGGGRRSPIKASRGPHIPT